MFERKVGDLFLTLPLNGGMRDVMISDIEIISPVVDLSKLNSRQIEALRDGVEETIRDRAKGCSTTAGLRLAFQDKTPELRKGIAWRAHSANIGTAKIQPIGNVPPEQNRFIAIE